MVFLAFFLVTQILSWFQECFLCRVSYNLRVLLFTMLQKKEKNQLFFLQIFPVTQGQDFPPGPSELRSAGGEQLTAVRDEQQFIHLETADGRRSYITAFDRHASNGVIHTVDSVL